MLHERGEMEYRQQAEPMLSGWGKITDAEMSRIAERFGKWRTVSAFNRDCTYDNFRQFAWGAGNVNPLFQDEEYAAKSRWGGLVAHPMYGVTMFRYPGQSAGSPGFPGVHATHASFVWMFYHPFRLVDRLTPKVAMWEHYLVPSRLAGRMLDSIRRNVIVDACRGRVVAEAWNMTKRWERDAARERRDIVGPHVGWKRHVWTEEDLHSLWEDFDKIYHRGSETLYWEDVQVGDEVPTYVTMPYTGREEISFDQGAGTPFMMSGEVMYNFFKRHPGANVPDPETRTPDVPERTHYDRDFARYAGFPDMFDVLEPRISYGTNMITNWMGDDAFLREISMLGRRPVAYGDVCWIHGQVVEKYQKGPENLVKIVMCYDTQKWRASYGHALVSLPSRERGAVVLPKAPPDPEMKPHKWKKTTPDYIKGIIYQREPSLPNRARIHDILDVGKS